MAVTSLWAIRGQLQHIVDYVRNAQKTANPEMLDELHRTISYAENAYKTEQRYFVSGVNCRPETAYQAMCDSHKKSDKPLPVVCYHGYQSFAAGEVDAKTAHEIGVKLAQELWGDKFVVLVATHLNTDHFHNHFVLCSTSYVDGSRFHNDHAARRRMAEVSDRLCREYGLSVPESIYGKSKPYAERKAENDGKPTYSSLIRADVDLAISQSTVVRHFYVAMETLGYEIKRGKYLAVRYKGAERFRRLKTLGPDYTEEAIVRRIMENQRRIVPYQVQRNSSKTVRFHGVLQKHPRLSGLRALYYHYLYRMCILPKQKQSGQRATSLLREDIIKLDKLMAENNFLHRFKIDSLEQLSAHRATVNQELAVLDTARAQLRAKLKHPPAEEVRQQLRSEVCDITFRMAALRKELRLCDGVEERAEVMREKLQRIAEVERATRESDKSKSRPRADGRC